MEKYTLLEDFETLCLTVPTFPSGIPEAFAKLSKLFVAIEHRVFYGIS